MITLTELDCLRACNVLLVIALLRALWLRQPTE